MRAYSGLRQSLVGLMLAAGLVLAAGTGARADTSTTYQLEFNCSATCSFGTSAGTLVVSENTALTSLTYTFTLNTGWAFAGGGNTNVFMDVGGTGVTTSTPTVSNGTWTQVAAASIQADGFSTGTWNFGWDCTSCVGSSTVSGPSFSETFTGTNLAALVGFTSSGGVQVIAGVDVTCTPPGFTACPSGSAVNPTGVLGAVPLSSLGGGLPGLLTACAGLVAFARRRRKSLALA
jgi:hypothetical protein